MAQRVAQVLEVALRDRRDDDEAVARLHRHVQVLALEAGELRLLELVDHHRQDAFHQPDVEVLAQPGAAALQQRRLDRHRGVAGGEDVGREQAAVGRLRQVVLERELRHLVAAGRLHDRCVRRAGRLVALLSVAGDRAVHQPRIQLAHRRIVQPQPLHHAGPEVLDQHVAVADEPAGRVDRQRILQVQRDRPLAGVQVREIGAVPVAHRHAGAHRFAFRRLDLDHLGTHVGQPAGAVGAGDHRREIENAEPVQRACRKLGHRPSRVVKSRYVGSVRVLRIHRGTSGPSGYFGSRRGLQVPSGELHAAMVEHPYVARRHAAAETQLVRVAVVPPDLGAYRLPGEHR